MKKRGAKWLHKEVDQRLVFLLVVAILLPILIIDGWDSLFAADRDRLPAEHLRRQENAVDDLVQQKRLLHDGDLAKARGQLRDAIKNDDLNRQLSAQMVLHELEIKEASFDGQIAELKLQHELDNRELFLESQKAMLKWFGVRLAVLAACGWFGAMVVADRKGRRINRSR